MPERNISSSEHSVFNLIFGEKNQSLIPETRLSIYVLESSNSRRLTYFMPPMVSTPYAYYYCMRVVLCIEFLTATESDPPSLHPSAAALPTRRIYSSSTHSTTPGYTSTVCGPDPGV